MTTTTTQRRQGVNAGLGIKAPVKAATTANITLSGEQTIDGVACVTGDRVLVKNQTTASENGIYVCDTSAWDRDYDFDGTFDVVEGTMVQVNDGSTNASSVWRVSTSNPITIGSSSLSFERALLNDLSGISFTQAGTGAVDEDAQTTLRRIIYPEQFGATGDGVTDDSANFQLAATAAVGKILKATPGATYVIAGINIGANTTVDMTAGTVKLKVLGTLVSSPIFNVTGAKVTFIGGDMDGQKSSQPADGFSDSFNTGGSGRGRAFRAAIKADAVATPGITDLTVRGVRFLNTFGACVATNDVAVVRIQDCKAKTCNFELAYLYYTATQGTDAIVTGNVIDTPASGDATVNANCIGVINYRRVVITGNSGFSSERDLIKVDGGRNITITNNVLDTSTLSFPCIQVAGSAIYGGATARVVVSNNQAFNSGVGIKVTDSGHAQVVIIGNAVYTTTHASTADGIAVDDADDLVISGNSLYDIKRHGIIVQGLCNRVTVEGNSAYGQGGTGSSHGIIFALTDGSWNNAIVRGNLIQNFTSGPATSGTVYMDRSSTYVINNIIVHGNLILSGAAANRGFYADKDLFATGLFADNYIDGQFETQSSTPSYRNNTVTGTMAFPAGKANVEEKGATQTTVGAAGAATALPAQPTGYHEIIVNGTARVVPFYAKS